MKLSNSVITLLCLVCINDLGLKTSGAYSFHLQSKNWFYQLNSHRGKPSTMMVKHSMPRKLQFKPRVQAELIISFTRFN